MKGDGAAALTLPVTVEFEDVDSYRIAHHTKLIAYCERARVRLFDGLGLDQQPGSTDMVMYEIRARFRLAARLLDDLEVSVAVESLEEHRFALAYRIRRDGALVAKVRTSFAFRDAVSGEIVPVPEDYARGLDGVR